MCGILVPVNMKGVKTLIVDICKLGKVLSSMDSRGYPPHTTDDSLAEIRKVSCRRLIKIEDLW